MNTKNIQIEVPADVPMIEVIEEIVTRAGNGESDEHIVVAVERRINGKNIRDEYKLANRLWRLVVDNKIDDQTYIRLMQTIDPTIRNAAKTTNGPALRYQWQDWERGLLFNMSKSC